MAKYVPLVYQFLGMEPDGISIGSFSPADCPEIIKKISDYRIKQIKKIRDSGLFDALDALPYYHTYRDFCLESKYKTPGRTDYIGIGASLSAFDPTVEDYLAYIQVHDPELAAFFLREFKAYIPESSRNYHTYIVGKSRSGKTHLMKQLVWYDYRNRNCSTIVIDPHGDMSKEILKWQDHREDFGRIVYVCPTLDRKRTPVFNPLQLDKKQNIDVAIQELMYAFAGILQLDWSPNMEAVLKNCLSVLMRRKESTLLDLLRFLSEGNNEDLIELGIRSKNRNTSMFFDDVFQGTRLNATKNAIYMKMQSLLSSETFFRLVIGKSTFDIRKLMNSRGKLIIFNLSQGAIGPEVSSAFGRFILSMILASTRGREKIPEKFRVPCRIHVDECQNFVNKSLETMLSEAGKYRISLNMAHQFLKQITDSMILSSMLSNSITKIVGKNDNDVYEKMAANIGTKKEELQKLKRRQFWIINDDRKPFMFNSSAFLAGDSRSMNENEQQEMIRYQLKNYYSELPGSSDNPENPKNPGDPGEKPEREDEFTPEI